MSPKTPQDDKAKARAALDELTAEAESMGMYEHFRQQVGPTDPRWKPLEEPQPAQPAVKKRYSYD